MSNPYSREAMAARYYELCDQRDAVYEQCKPLEAALDEQNAIEQSARSKAMELSAQIDAKRGGGQSWFDLKRQISVLANALHTIPRARDGMPRGLRIGSTARRLFADAATYALIGQTATLTYGGGSPPAGLDDVQFSLTSTVGGSNLPFAIGHAFKEGDVPNAAVLGADTAIQVNSKATWPDGSVKFAIISGRKTLTADVPANVTLSNTGTVASGSTLTTTDLQSTGISVGIAPTSVKDYTFDTATHLIGANMVMVDVNGNAIAGTPTSFDITVNNGASLANKTSTANGSTAQILTADLSGGTAGALQTVTFTLNYNDLGGTPRQVVKTEATYVRTGGGIEWTVGLLRNWFAASNVGTATSVSWSGSDWAAPFQAVTSGPEMSSWTYRKQMGPDAHLWAWLEMRLFVGGKVEALAWVENGFLDATGQTARLATWDLTINGGSRYSGETPLYPQQTVVLASGWPITHWLATDPAIIPEHDITYLNSTKLVPNYWKRNPSSTALNAQTQAYTPGSIGQHTTPMGAAGFQNAIGILPNWEALYCTSGDARAYKAVEVNSAHFRTFPVAWRDSATGLMVQPSLRPTWTFFGAGAGGGYTRSAGSNQWELNHHPSAGFLAYLISGRQFHYETLAGSCATCYLSNSSTQGSGVNRLMNAEDRGIAWMQRTFGQLAAIGGSEAVAADYRSLIANTITWWKNNRVNAAGINQLGYIHSYQLAGNAYGTGRLGPWMHSWWVAANGYLFDMKSLDSQTDLIAVRDWMYRIPVGYLGVSGNTSAHSFTKAGQYSLKVSDTQNSDPTIWYDSWGDVHTNSYGSSNSSASNTLESVTSPHQGNGWGEGLGSIAYAVDHGASGAFASYARLIGASNFSSIENAGFDDTPVWGVVPRLTALASAAAGMSAGQWVQLSVNGLTTTMFSTGASNTIDYLDKGCYDPTNKQVRFIGAGHLVDLRWHQYDEAANRWSVLVDPSWDDGSPESSVSQPSSGGSASFNFHGYQNNALDPATGDQYVRRFGGSGTIHRHTRSTNTWSTITAQGSGAYGVGATEWLPSIGSQGGIITLQYDTVQRWDKQSGTFSNFTIPVARQNHPIAQRSIPHNLVLFGGGDGDSNLYSIGPTGGITTRAACPIGMGVTQSVTVTCPVSGDLIVIGGSGNARKYNVATDTWSTLTFSGAPAALPADIADTTYVAAIPISTYGVIMFLFPETPSVWLYKHA